MNSDLDIDSVQNRNHDRDILDDEQARHYGQDYAYDDFNIHIYLSLLKRMEESALALSADQHALSRRRGD